MPARLQSGQAAPRAGRRGRRERRQYRRAAPQRRVQQRSYRRYYRKQVGPTRNAGRDIGRGRDLRHQRRLADHRKRVRVKQQQKAKRQRLLIKRRSAYSLDPRLQRSPKSERRRVRVARKQARTFRRTPAYRNRTISGYARAGTKTSGPVGTIGRELRSSLLEGTGGLQEGARWLGENVQLPLTTGAVGDPDRETKLVKPRGVGKALLQDLFDLPANVIPSVYQPGAAILEAVQGRPQRLKRVTAELKETDPVALVAQRRWDDALRAAKEHPLATALELAGGKAVVGRGIGAGGRLGGARFASRDRGEAKLSGTGLRVKRRYSPDVITKGGQVLADRGRRRVRLRKLKDADEAQSRGRMAIAHKKRVEARRLDPEVIQPRELRQRADEYESLAAGRSRKHGGDIDRSLSRLKLGRGGAASRLIAERIVRADPDDLMAYHRELEAVYPDLDPAKQAANDQLRKQIRQVLKAKKVDLGEADKSARAYAAVTNELERELVARKIIEDPRAEKAKLIPYAVRFMGARYDTERKRISPRQRELGISRGKNEPRDAYEGRVHAAAEKAGVKPRLKKAPVIVGDDGKPLSTAAIRAHMEANDVPEPAFVSQAPNTRGAKNFYRSWFPRETERFDARTGAATREGTFDAHPEVLREQARRMQLLIDQDENFKGFVREFAIKDKDAPIQLKNKADAERAVREWQAREPGRRVRAVRMNPWYGKGEQLQSVLEDVRERSDRPGGEDAGEAAPMLDALEDAIQGKGKGPWTLVDEEAAQRFYDHLQVVRVGGGTRAWQAVGGQFRRTVLTTSPPWMTGNILEATGRGAIKRALPIPGTRAYSTGKRIKVSARKQDPRAAEDLEVRALSGGHAGMQQRITHHRSAEQFEGKSGERLVRSFALVRRAKGPKQVADGWKAYTTGVFHVNNWIETQFQTALMGRYARENLMDGQMLKSSQKAIDQAARGLLNTNEQVQLARYIDRAYGKYGKFGPGLRSFVSTYTPFIAWTLNALRFLGSVLPKDHPILTGAIASAYQASEDWRADQGLAKFIDEALPGFLQGALVLSGGRKLRISRYLPFGVAADPFGTFAQLFLPQISSAMMAAKGLDFTGRPVRFDGKEPDDIQKGGLILKALAEGTVPLLSQGIRASKKEGDIWSKLGQTFNPVQPIAKKKSSKEESEIERMRKKYGIEVKGSSIEEERKRYGLPTGEDPEIMELRKKYGLAK